jgi:hypothetical protein
MVSRESGATTAVPSTGSVKVLSIEIVMASAGFFGPAQPDSSKALPIRFIPTVERKYKQNNFIALGQTVGKMGKYV